MVKRISNIVISAVILVTGYIALEKLNFWERSIRIFKTRNTEQYFEGISGRGHGRFDERQMPGTRPEFDRRGGGEQRFERSRNRVLPDSIRQQFRTNTRGQVPGVTQFERGIRNGERHGRGEFQRGKKVYLKNVMWFTLAFSFFTLIVLYLDRAYCFILKKINQSEEST